jgi:hypothetical protein
VACVRRARLEIIKEKASLRLDVVAARSRLGASRADRI